MGITYDVFNFKVNQVYVSVPMNTKPHTSKDNNIVVLSDSKSIKTTSKDCNCSRGRTLEITIGSVS